MKEIEKEYLETLCPDDIRGFDGHYSTAYVEWLEEKASSCKPYIMRLSPSEEDLKTVTFWLTNILLHVEEKKKIELLKQLADRVGYYVYSNKQFHPIT
jgi:hypothetical protein